MRSLLKMCPRLQLNRFRFATSASNCPATVRATVIVGCVIGIVLLFHPLATAQTVPCQAPNQLQPCTQNFNLVLPANNTLNWGQLVNQNFAAVDGIFGRNNAWTGNNSFSGAFSISALLSGTKGLFTSPGVFSSAAQTDYFQVLLNGIDPKTEYQSGGFIQNQTEAMVGGLAVPSSSTVIQANGIAAYASNRSTATNAVALYSHCRSLATGAPCWGSNPLVVSTAGSPTNLIGQETDVNIANVADTAAGVTVAGFWTAASTQANGFIVGVPGGATGGKWNVAFLTSANCCANAMIVAPANVTANSPSQPILFQNIDGGTVTRNSTLNTDAAGNFQMFPAGGTVQANGNLSITNALTVHSLFTFVRVATDFTVAANTSLQAIPGLSLILVANDPQTVPFSCHLLYSQATAAVADQFGVQTVSLAPTSIMVKAQANTSATAFTAGNVPALTTTTATPVVTFTPSATATVFSADMDGMIENASGVASTFNIMVQTSNASDLITVKRGSFCRVY